MVSQEELSKLEDELLATFAKARPRSGAYSGSNHVTNPSTSSLPDPSAFSMYRFQLFFLCLA